MKLQVTKLPLTIGSIAAALIFAVVFSACESEIIDTSKPEAKLLSLKIGDLDMRSIPIPVDNRDWINDEHGLFDEDFKTIAFKHDEDIEDAWFEPTVSRGAKVKYGIANRTVRPNYFYDTRVPATFDRGDFLYFEVTSQDGEITNYYRFSTYISSPVKELSSIAVAGREGDILASGDTWNSDAIVPGSLHVTRTEAARAVIDAVPWAETAAIRYAKTERVTNQPSFGNNNVFSVTDGEYLWIEVTAENTEKNIYCFRLYVGRIATVGKLTFKNPGRAQAEDKGIYEALGKGTAKNLWSDNTGAGSFESPHQPTEGFVFEVELDDPDGHWEYAKMDRLTGTQPTWINPNNNAATPTLHFNHDEYLAIKVVPVNRQGSAPDYFYKVKVGLLAAEFTVQPKSHAYKVNDPAEALRFELDRPLSGATYQWYEANSWYGGYGFDSVGRIGGKGAIQADPDFGVDDQGEIDGIPYNVTPWHVKELDEKTNVSLHNGGNQYYRLPTPGKPIPGAQSDTYTPPTNHHPFLAGFSSETHYYWVEVTANNLKAVSKRAVIVTEWGQEWNLGEPSKDDDGNPITVNKEHYIIDLYAYQTPGTSYGLQEPPRNTRPFNKGNHGDEYYIPVNFPSGFDIYDYSVFTAQALFFLTDGRPWIQNWTQGDIGFAKDKIGDDGKVVPGEIEEIVLWYNLTNDNATRGLASSGNEPQGAGLSVTPQYIVVKPAGTKPINRMPPFNADGTPTNNGDAQGWFTPYIELCEVRFEGPPREKPKD